MPNFKLRPSPNKAAKPKRRQLPGAHRLLKDSWQLFWRHRRVLAAVMAINVAVNVALTFFATSELKAVYQGLWFNFASCALIWTIRHLSTKTEPTLSQAYWQGTAPALKFIVVLAVLVLASVPLSIGAFLVGIIGWLISTSLVIRLLATTTWLVLSGLSLLLLARLILAVLIATLPEIGPFQAVALSWRASRGLAWRLSGRLLILLSYSLVISIGFAVALSHWLALSTLGNLLNQIVSFGLVIPLVYIFLFRLYQEAV